MRTKLLACTLASFLLVSASAHAASLGVVGLMNMSGSSSTYTPSVVSPQSLSGTTTFGGGAFLRGSGPLTFELGVNYVPRQLNFGSGNFTFNTLEVPLLLRMRVLFLSFAAGGYYGYRLGSVGGTPPAGTFGSNDFGLDFAAGLEFPLAPAVSLMAEARYIFGLVDQGNATFGTLHWRNWEVVAGFDFGF